MLGAAIITFIIAAILGSIVLSAILKNKPTPKPIAILHGSLGGIALLMALTYLAVGEINTLLITGLSLLVLALIGGLILFGIDISNKPIPKALALLHPMFAGAGLIALIIYYFEKT